MEVRQIHVPVLVWGECRPIFEEKANAVQKRTSSGGRRMGLACLVQDYIGQHLDDDARSGHQMGMVPQLVSD